MTAQIQDRFIYKEKSYQLTGYSEEEPFNPAQLGFQPVGACTACWRGYVAEYSLDQSESLILKNLFLSLFEVDKKEWRKIEGKAINGVLPTKATDDSMSFLNNWYKNIDIPIPYTGGFLIADQFITNLYVHMGFHPAWKYSEVHELVFEKGKLTLAKDKSEDMQNFRKKFASGKLQPDFDARDKEIKAWIDQAFDRKYTR